MEEWLPDWKFQCPQARWRLTSHALYYKIPYNPPLLFEVVVACPLLIEIVFNLGKKSTENSDLGLQLGTTTRLGSAGDSTLIDL